MSSNSIFTNFTNLYSLTKTLRFELKPSEETKLLLNFERDQERAFYYKKIKLLFDQLHRDFIAKSLAYYSGQNVDYQEFWNVYTGFLDAKKAKKKDDTQTQKNFITAKDNFDKVKSLYRKNLVNYFGQYAENWKLEINQILAEKYPDKYSKIDPKTQQIKGCLTAKGIEVLTESGILEVLKHYLEADKFLNEQQMPFSELEKQEMLNGINFFDKFFTYFGPFNTTRENFYKDDGTATAVATRIIDENLVRFCDNILLVNSELKVGEKSFVPIQANIDCSKTIFELGSFNQFVDQKGINLYNGGQNGDQNLGDFNSKINQYILQILKVDRARKLPFKNLYKIMLSEKTSIFEEETAQSCIDILNQVSEQNQNWLPQIEQIFNQIFDHRNDDLFLEKIYLKKESVNELSTTFFGGLNWYILETAIKDLGYSEKIDKNYKNFLPLYALKSALESLANGSYGSLKLSKKTKSKKQDSEQLFQESSLKGYKAEDLFKPELLNQENKKSLDLWGIFVDLWQREIIIKMNNTQNLTLVCAKELFNAAKYEPLLETNYTHLETFKDQSQSIVQTQANLAKLYLDSCMELWRAVKMFELVKTESRKPVLFYDDLKDEQNQEFYEVVKNYFEDFTLFKQYDKIRNFSTKKPFSTSKFKINFENSTLLDGWDLNKEPDNTAIILKTTIGYELVIMNSKHNKIFDKVKNPELYSTEVQEYWKMEYKLLPGPNKMLPKVAFAVTNRVLFKEIFAKYQNIEEIRASETFKKEKMVKQDLNTWISFYQDILNTYPDWKKFNWNFRKPEEYEDVSKFYRDVQVQGYRLGFIPVNNKILEKLESDGKIYRFQIKNKDWNEFSKGSKNLQTIYWEQLFSPDNLAQNTLKLNGEAEIFQRLKTASLKNEQKIDRNNKLIFKGKTDQKVLVNQRYLEDKMFFHVPIAINFSAKEITKYNTFLQENLPKEGINYLGIDRGENHLLYYSLINSKGEILKQASLNTFSGVDYERLLNAKQEDRKTAKDKWSVIGNIKELKSGYLSLAVGEICKLAFENNALIVLENLNFGFKKSRTIKFEKSVYQKFEVALATKLQHIVFKNKSPNELGGVLNALQLAPKLDKVSDLDKSDQWGIIKYVAASYTSQICPLTGWHKTIYLKDNVSEIKQRFNPDEINLITIDWDIKLKCYTFSYKTDIKNIPNCTLYVLPEIIRTTYKDKTLQTTKEGELADQLAALLDPQLGSSDKSRINEIIFEQFEDQHWKKLRYIFDQICNIRVKVNNKTEKLDVIQSAVAFDFKNEKIFFDTRKVAQIQEKLGKTLPVDGDANGAFHIAKKGLELVNKTL